MKKLISMAVISALTAALFASGVENKTNLNGGYIRNPSRNTENQRAEAAFYNIAGTAFLEDGFYVDAGNQVVFKKYSNKLDTNNTYGASTAGGPCYGQPYAFDDYESYDDGSVYLYPDFDVVYKKNNFAMFGTFGIYAGGGSLSFDEGTSATSLLFLNGASELKASATQAKLASLGAGGAATQYKTGIESAVSGYGMTWDNVVTIMNAPESALSDAQKTVKAAVKDSYENYVTYSGLNQKYEKEYVEYAKAATVSAKMSSNHDLSVRSLTYGGQIGIAYRHPSCDWLSLSGAYRYTYGTQRMTIKYTASTPGDMLPYDSSDISTAFDVKSVLSGKKISYEANGWGQSIVFGVHAKPPVVPGLDLSLQYQTLSRIEYDVSKVKNEDFAKYYDITDDKNFRTDLPAVLNLGAGYSVLDNLYVSSSFNYYFNDFAHQDNVLAATDYENSWELAFGVDWRICKYVGASCGASYGKQGITDTSNSTFNPVLDNYVIGGGFEIYPSENLTFTAACLYANYFDADYYLSEKSSATKTVLAKEVTNMAFGVTYRFPVK